MKLRSTKDLTSLYIKSVVYGPSGAGKTTLASTMPGRVLIISAESGLLSVRGKDLQFVDVTRDDDDNIIPEERRWAEVGAAYKALTTGPFKGKFDSVAIDSVTELGECLYKTLRIKYPSMTDNMKLWGDFKTTMMGMIKSFRDLDMNVLVIVQETIDKDENGKRFSDLSVSGKSSEAIPYNFDVVGYLNAFKQEDGSTRRFLMTQKEEWNRSKDRSSFLNAHEEPNMSVIIEKVKAGLEAEIAKNSGVVDVSGTPATDK